MDFDDILYYTNVLLRDNPQILYKYQNHFKYILVDEYQDTNFAQYLIVRRLAALFENLCVVGDDAQSIYGFRGANIQNILNFKNDYPDYKLIRLEQNYRSTKTIVEASNNIIAHNKDQIKKRVWSDNEQGELITLLHAATDSEEGVMVANSIFHYKMSRQLNNKDFAILYRTNAQSRSMEAALRKQNIPYKIYGGLSFYDRKEIKDLLAYFRVVINPEDEQSLLRIINYPARGIGEKSIERMMVFANERKTSIWQCISNDQFPQDFNMGTINRVRDFVVLIKSFQSLQGKMNAFELAKHITNSIGIIKLLKEEDTPESVSRVENIEELLNAIMEFSDQQVDETTGEAAQVDLVRFMEDVALLTDNEMKKDDNTEDCVSLMTIHSAKGLEFPYVYVVGLEENLFPGILSLSTREELEEERRLFYVAVTRAMTKLTLSCAETRYRYGNSSSTSQEKPPSMALHLSTKNVVAGDADPVSDQAEVAMVVIPRPERPSPIPKNMASKRSPTLLLINLRQALQANHLRHPIPTCCKRDSVCSTKSSAKAPSSPSMAPAPTKKPPFASTLLEQNN